MEIFHWLKTGEYQLNLEEVYTTIAKYSPDYHIFRVIVWGTAYYLVCRTFKLLNLNYDISVFFFTSLFLYRFSYARVSLSMALMYFGFALCAVKNKRQLLIGLAVIVISFYFHKSSLFGIAIILASILVGNMTNFKMKLLLLSFPIWVFVIQVLVGDYLAMDFERDGMNMGMGQTYMTNEYVEIGIGEFIMNTLWRSTIYLIAYLYYKIISTGEYNTLPKSDKLLANATFLTIYASSIFAFDLGINTTVIYNRFMNFCMIPSACFLSYCYSNNLNKKLVKIIVYVGVAAAIYTLLYSTYLNNDNSAKYMLILNSYLRGL